MEFKLENCWFWTMKLVITDIEKLRSDLLNTKSNISFQYYTFNSNDKES